MLITLIITLIVLYLIAKLCLTGPDLSIYDNPAGERFNEHEDDREATENLAKVLQQVRKQASSTKSPFGFLRVVRKFANELSDELETDTTFRAVIANGVPCEWAIRADSNPNHRVLFLHGGAFLFGSSKGHRLFTDKLAKVTGGAVLSVDYRMLPENARRASIIDAQKAYHWVLQNGPDNSEPVGKLIVAGDSAGGNLALMLSGWSKTGAERKPDAVIAFSPSTDSTFVSPTIKANTKTDKMLGPSLGWVSKLPTAIRVWLGLCILRANPANPLVTPLFQDLSGLAPTLIHASSSEILLGDANRYTNKARVSGSNVRLQVWDNQIHDWHLFNMGHGSANTAWQEIENFVSPILRAETTSN